MAKTTKIQLNYEASKAASLHEKRAIKLLRMSKDVEDSFTIRNRGEATIGRRIPFSVQTD
jgi:hypothetical protein